MPPESVINGYWWIVRVKCNCFSVGSLHFQVFVLYLMLLDPPVEAHGFSAFVPDVSCPREILSLSIAIALDFVVCVASPQQKDGSP